MTIFSLSRKSITLMKAPSSMLWDLPTPSSISYMWNFGSMLGICLFTQILSGIFLTFHYSAYAEQSFSSVVHIMTNTWSGWLIRMIHMNGASVFFVFIYLHLFRGLFFFSGTHKKVWMSGILILLLLMGTSFLGYVLPWGQMSYWAVAVITNLLSVAPVIGDEAVKWVWGGFSVGEPTLTRFFSFHFLLPMILSMVVMGHLLLLHDKGSSNSLGLPSNLDKVPFHPYFSIKDLTFIILAMYVSFMVSVITPYVAGDPVNNVPANPMQTPVHIQPEWYFLTSYAILRALPSKTAGVIALLMSILMFSVMAVKNYKFSMKFSYSRYFTFWTLLAVFFTLMLLGALPAEEPYVALSKIQTMAYFTLVLILN